MLVELNYILNSGIVMLGLFLFVFFAKNRETESNFWLAFIHLVLSFHFLNLLLLEKVTFTHYGMVFGLLYGPLIFYFVRSHIETFNKKELIHFIPATALLAWILISTMRREPTPAVELDIIRVLVFLHLLCYLVSAYHLSKKYKKIAVQTRSKLEDDKISLIQKSISIIAILFLIALLQSYLVVDQAKLVYELSVLAISGILILGMFSLIYRGMDNPQLFLTFTSNEKQIGLESSNYTSSALTVQMADTYLKQLTDFIASEKPYKIENLGIDKLAELTEIPPRYLSQIINQKLDQNFFDFINSHRIQEAQEQLNHSNRRISEIMYDVGFSSRSSFNSAFKKYTNLTPSQYRRKLSSN
jgi:AraC-like DNA-binding protein